MSTPAQPAARPRLTDQNRVAVAAYADQHQIGFNAAANLLIRLGVVAAAQHRNLT